MKKLLIVFLCSLYPVCVLCGGSGGHITGFDDRRYAQLNHPDYRGVCRLSGKTGSCTGTFISRNLILTNSHCVAKGIMMATAEFWNGKQIERSNVSPIKSNQNYQVVDGTDWAVLYSDKPNPLYQGIRSSSPLSGLIRYGGFGSLRVVSDAEMPELTALYKQVVKKYKEECRNDFGCINKKMDDELKKQGKKPLTGDSKNFKIQDCHILGVSPKGKNMLITDCDTASGNSGSSYLIGNNIVGLHNSGYTHDIFADQSMGAQGVKTEIFYTQVQDLIKKYEMEPDKPTISNTTTGNSGMTTLGGTNNQSTVNNNSGGNEQQNIDQFMQQYLQGFECD